MNARVSREAKGHGPGRSWKARLSLGFAPKHGRTALDRMEFFGPLRVQRPFYPEGAPCHCYLLHPPGGLVSGDVLAIDAACAPGAHALLTTPSAGKIYGADSQNAPQGQEVRLSARDADIEWLPMETIVFDRANARLGLELDLFGKARAAGWEVVCLGRPEGKRPFVSGGLSQRLSIRRDGVPLLLDRLDVAGGGEFQRQAFGLGGEPVFATMFATGFADDAQARALLAPLRELLKNAKEGACAATFRRETLMARYLGRNAREARALFEKAWGLIRPELFGRPACPPRIWST